MNPGAYLAFGGGCHLSLVNVGDYLGHGGQSDEQLILQTLSWISEQCQNSALEPGGPIFILGSQLDRSDNTSRKTEASPQESAKGPLSFLDLTCKPSKAMIAMTLTLLHCSLKGLRDARPPLVCCSWMTL